MPAPPALSDQPKPAAAKAGCAGEHDWTEWTDDRDTCSELRWCEGCDAFQWQPMLVELATAEQS